MSAIALSTPSSTLTVYPKFITAEEAELILAYYIGVSDALDHPDLFVWGKTVKQPRLTKFYSDHTFEYGYSKYKAQAAPMPEWMKLIMFRVNRQLGSKFNGVLINFYRTGEDKIGAHANDERELSPEGQVATLSIGSKRRFILTPHAKTKEAPPTVSVRAPAFLPDPAKRRWEVPLCNGELVVMSGAFQREFYHEIPAEARVKTPRVSLTFRYHANTHKPVRQANLVGESNANAQRPLIVGGRLRNGGAAAAGPARDKSPSPKSVKRTVRSRSPSPKKASSGGKSSGSTTVNDNSFLQRNASKRRKE